MCSARCASLLSLPATTRGLAGPPRRLAVRRPRDGHEGLLHGRATSARTTSCSAEADEDAFVRRGAGVAWGRSRRTSRRSSSSTAAARRPTVPTPRPLTPRQVELKRAEGALLVDVRTDLQFDDAHVGGAIAITALRAGLRLQARVARRPRAGGRADRPRRRRRPPRRRPRRRRRHHPLRRLPRGRDDELARGPPPGRAHRAASPLDELHERWEADRDACRCSTSASATSGTRATSRARSFTPYHDLTGDCPTISTPDGPIAVVCASGQRARSAASLLAAPRRPRGPARGRRRGRRPGGRPAG